MQQKVFFSQRKAAVVLSFLLLLLIQQVSAGPLGPSGADQRAHPSGVGTLRRMARMTPLWRIMNSKPFGAYCQNNFECATGICRAGYCSRNHRARSETATY
uniref:Uncharacterized protein n=1 Tax=Mola mola TaxID=94237 RepID=A0A3Q3WMY8_MOLML